MTNIKCSLHPIIQKLKAKSRIHFLNDCCLLMINYGWKICCFQVETKLQAVMFNVSNSYEPRRLQNTKTEQHESEENMSYWIRSVGEVTKKHRRSKQNREFEHEDVLHIFVSFTCLHSITYLCFLHTSALT